MLLDGIRDSNSFFLSLLFVSQRARCRIQRVAKIFSCFTNFDHFFTTYLYLPSPPFQCHLVFTKRWPVSWNIIWGKGGLSSNFWKINYIISFGFVEWTVVDHLLTEAGQCLDHFFYSLLWSLNTPLFCVKAQHLKKLQINPFLLTPLPLLP